MITKEGKMAVTYNSALISALSSAGAEVGEFLDAKKSWGLKIVQVGAGNLKFMAPDGEVITAIKMTPEQVGKSVAELMKDSTFMLALHVAKAQVVQAAKQYGAAYSVSNTPKPLPEIKGTSGLKAVLGLEDALKFAPPGAIGIGSPFSVAKPAPTPAMSLLTGQAAPGASSYPVLDPSAKDDAIPLREATGLYRAVKGSDPGSRYFLVADFGSLKVAARWRMEKLSVRVEGNDFSKFAMALGEAGMVINGPNHASIHVGVDDPVIANKTVGSVVFSVANALSGENTPLLSPLPNMTTILNKGK